MTINTIRNIGTTIGGTNQRLIDQLHREIAITASRSYRRVTILPAASTFFAVFQPYPQMWLNLNALVGPTALLTLLTLRLVPGSCRISSQRRVERGGIGAR